MWFTIVSVLYVLICAFLIMVVLLQQGKGGGMGSAFGGGGGSNTVFGGAGAGNFLTRMTAIAATLFMVLSAVLAYMSTSGEREFDVVEDVEAEQTESTIGGDEDGDEADEPEAGEPEAGEPEDVPLTTEDAIEQEADEALDEFEDSLEDAIDGEGEEPIVDEPDPEPEAAAPAPAPAAPRPRPRPAPQPEAAAPAPSPAPAAEPEPAPAEPEPTPPIEEEAPTE